MPTEQQTAELWDSLTLDERICYFRVSRTSLTTYMSWAELTTMEKSRIRSRHEAVVSRMAQDWYA